MKNANSPNHQSQPARPEISRRHFLGTAAGAFSLAGTGSLLLPAIGAGLLATPSSSRAVGVEGEVVGITEAEDDAVRDIGSRLELFVDRWLVQDLQGVSFQLHTPELAPPVNPPRPQGHYATVLRDGDRFQFYYRGDKDPKVGWKTHGWEVYHEGEVTLVAESKDAIHWTLPKLGLFEHPSFPAGNIVLMGEFPVNHNFTPFIDTKPGTPPDQKYKALGGLAYQCTRCIRKSARAVGRAG